MGGASVEAGKEGAIFTVRACPGARREAVQGIWNGMVQVATTAAPEKGKANQRILGLLADFLGVARSRLSFRAGECSRTKRIQVLGAAAEEIASLLARLPEKR